MISISSKMIILKLNRMEKYKNDLEEYRLFKKHPKWGIFIITYFCMDDGVIDYSNSKIIIINVKSNKHISGHYEEQ
jgi:hypothetical protein